jgi:hypothetical protein
VIIRGPPKKHSAILITRLEQTENVLLNALRLLSDEQLQQCFQELPLGSDANPSTESADENAPVEEKHGFGTEYWATFPLTSPQALRRWQLNRSQNTQIYFRTSQNPDPTTVTSTEEDSLNRIISNENAWAQHELENEVLDGERNAVSPTAMSSNSATVGGVIPPHAPRNQIEQPNVFDVNLTNPAVEESQDSPATDRRISRRPNDPIVFDAAFENDFVW